MSSRRRISEKVSATAEEIVQYITNIQYVVLGDYKEGDKFVTNCSIRDSVISHLSMYGDNQPGNSKLDEEKLVDDFKNLEMKDEAAVLFRERKFSGARELYKTIFAKGIGKIYALLRVIECDVMLDDVIAHEHDVTALTSYIINMNITNEILSNLAENLISKGSFMMAFYVNYALYITRKFGVDLIKFTEKLMKEMFKIARGVSKTGKAPTEKFLKFSLPFLRELLQKVVDIPAENLQITESIAKCCYYYALCYSSCRRYDVALDLNLKTIRFMDEVLKENKSEYRLYGQFFNNVGFCSERLGRRSESIESFQNAISIYDVAKDWENSQQKQREVSLTETNLKCMNENRDGELYCPIHQTE